MANPSKSSRWSALTGQSPSQTKSQKPAPDPTLSFEAWLQEHMNSPHANFVKNTLSQYAILVHIGMLASQAHSRWLLTREHSLLRKLLRLLAQQKQRSQAHTQITPEDVEDAEVMEDKLLKSYIPRLEPTIRSIENTLEKIAEIKQNVFEQTIQHHQAMAALFESTHHQILNIAEQAIATLAPQLRPEAHTEWTEFLQEQRAIQEEQALIEKTTLSIRHSAPKLTPHSTIETDHPDQKALVHDHLFVSVVEHQHAAMMTELRMIATLMMLRRRVQELLPSKQRDRFLEPFMKTEKDVKAQAVHFIKQQDGFIQQKRADLNTEMRQFYQLEASLRKDTDALDPEQPTHPHRFTPFRTTPFG